MQPVKVLFGSTNFSFRGLYIQANNALVFYAPEAAALFEQVFDLAFNDPSGFATDPISHQWHLVQVPGKPLCIFAFRRTPTPVCHSIRSAPPSTRRHHRSSFPLPFSTRQIGAAAGGHRPIDEQERLQLRNFRQAGRLNVKSPMALSASSISTISRSITPKPFKSEWFGGSRHPRTSQIRRHRLQPAERQGIHRLVESFAER